MKGLSQEQKQEIFQFGPEERSVLLDFFPRGVVGMDLESTGLSPMIDRIVELSAFKILPSSMEVEVFDQLINPGGPIPPRAIGIHGITDEMVSQAPSCAEVMPRFLEFLHGLPIIAHNAKFDIGFIVFSSIQLGLEWGASPVYCSCQLARKTLGHTVANKRLPTLASHFGIPLFQAHRALSDAAAALHVYAQCLLSLAPGGGERSQRVAESHLFTMTDFLTVGQEQGTGLPGHLKLLLEKIPDQGPLEIKYRGGHHQGKFRPLCPVSLLLLPQGHCLYAHCLLSDQYKSFFLSKIAEVRELSPQGELHWQRYLENKEEGKS